MVASISTRSENDTDDADCAHLDVHPANDSIAPEVMSEPATPRRPRTCRRRPGPRRATAFDALVELMRILRQPDRLSVGSRADARHRCSRSCSRRRTRWSTPSSAATSTSCRAKSATSMFEGVFLAQLCAETGDFTITDALNDVRAKLVRRHPHVFAPDAGTADVTTPQAVQEASGSRSRRPSGPRRARAREGLFDGIPKTLPALLRASRNRPSAAARSASTGRRAAAVLEKIDEEIGGAARGARQPANGRTSKRSSAICCSRCRTSRASSDHEPEAALRAANRKFMRRFGAMQARLAEAGTPLGIDARRSTRWKPPGERAEKGRERPSRIDGVPEGLPALLRAVPHFGEGGHGRLRVADARSRCSRRSTRRLAEVREALAERRSRRTSPRR